jgi:uncharacterized protein
MPPLIELLILLGAALVAGALNAVAGGGSFFTVPALLLVGVHPVMANATSTVALWPGAVASAWAYRREVVAVRQEALALAAVSMVGGIAGAVLLVKTPGEVFLRLLPFLLLVATVLFTFGNRLRAALGARAGSRGGRLAALVLQGAIAVYGGYFGGGMGLMMLAGLALLGLTDIHRMNGLKVVLSGLINGLAVVTFALAGVVDYRLALAMVAGAVVGGFTGAALARKLKQHWVRGFIIAVGWSMTAYFFLRTW